MRQRVNPPQGHLDSGERHRPDKRIVNRPLSVTFLTFGVLSLTGVHLVRLFQTINQWDFLTTLPLSVPPWYLALSGAFWSVVGLPLALGLWRGWPVSAAALRVNALLFAAYHWLDQVLLVSSPIRGVDISFRLGITLALLFLIFWILARPRTKHYFGVKHD